MILLIEDHELLRKVLERSLRTRGYEVVGTATADQARLLIEEGLTPTLVVSDVRMPGELNGVDFAHWLKLHRPRIPILLQTGYASESTAGFPVLRKPYTDGQLSDAVEHLMGSAPDAANDA